MNTTELFKVIGLDLASLGIVLMPVGWTATVIEGHIEFVIKVAVGIGTIHTGGSGSVLDLRLARGGSSASNVTIEKAVMVFTPVG